MTGTRQTMAEHRLYLPLAAVLVLAVLGLWRRPRRDGRRWSPRRSLALTVLGLGAWLTVRRNPRIYRSNKVTMYRDVVAKLPGKSAGARY